MGTWSSSAPTVESWGELAIGNHGSGNHYESYITARVGWKDSATAVAEVKLYYKMGSSGQQWAQQFKLSAKKDGATVQDSVYSLTPSASFQSYTRYYEFACEEGDSITFTHYNGTKEWTGACGVTPVIPERPAASASVSVYDGSWKDGEVFVYDGSWKSEEKIYAYDGSWKEAQ